MHRGIIPQGEGQTLVLSAQTNGRYYQSYQFNSWNPGSEKRPNNLSVSAYYSRYTGLNSDYYSQNAYNPYMYGYGGYGATHMVVDTGVMVVMVDTAAMVAMVVMVVTRTYPICLTPTRYSAC